MRHGSFISQGLSWHNLFCELLLLSDNLMRPFLGYNVSEDIESFLLNEFQCY